MQGDGQGAQGGGGWGQAWSDPEWGRGQLLLLSAHSRHDNKTFIRGGNLTEIHSCWSPITTTRAFLFQLWIWGISWPCALTTDTDWPPVAADLWMTGDNQTPGPDQVCSPQPAVWPPHTAVKLAGNHWEMKSKPLLPNSYYSMNVCFQSIRRGSIPHARIWASCQQREAIFGMTSNIYISTWVQFSLCKILLFVLLDFMLFSFVVLPDITWKSHPILFW